MALRRLLPAKLATAWPSVRARALLARRPLHEARLLALHTHLRHVRVDLLHRFPQGAAAPMRTLQTVCCRFTGRPEPHAELSQLKGTALPANARMRVRLFVRRIGRARAERAGRGLPKLLACFERVGLQSVPSGRVGHQSDLQVVHV